MIPNHAQFLQAVQERKKVWITFYSKADSGVLAQACAPLDYGPGSGVQDGLNRYWLWDYASPDGSHTLGLLPQQIVDLNMMGEVFDPTALSTESTSSPMPGVPASRAAAGAQAAQLSGCPAPSSPTSKSSLPITEPIAT